MIRKLIPAALIAGSALALTACSGGTINTPIGGVEVPSVTMPVDAGDVFGMQLQTQGFEPNADKTEYTKKGANGSGDVTIVVGSNGPTNVRYNNELLNCKPTTQSVINGAATSALGGTSDEVAKQFCGTK